MREIKFRAWDAEEKEWCFFDDINEERSTSGDLMSISTQRTFGVIDNNWEYNNNLIWSQYTGLKDKNGKEIYEGDKTSRGYVIMWSEKKALFCEHIYYEVLHRWSEASYPIDPSGIEIIGNIYERG